MGWLDFLHAARRSSSTPQRTPVDEEIDEELMFHLRSLVDDQLAKGASFDAAWRNAQERFGSLRRYADDCRQGAFGGLLWRGAPAIAIVVLSMLVGWLAVEVRSLRREQLARAAVERPLQAPLADAAADPLDVVGQIVDRHGRPIAGANVLVILKTWPGGWYRQENFAATSDATGRFCLPELVPTQSQFAVQVAALKDGYTLASAYQLKERSERQTVDPVTLTLGDASAITLVVQDDRGRPIANALVAPHSRKSSGGETHVIYFQACKPVQIACDSEGRAGLGCFEPGDRAEVYVQAPGKEWELHAIEVPSDGRAVEIEVAGADDGRPNAPAVTRATSQG